MKQSWIVFALAAACVAGWAYAQSKTERPKPAAKAAAGGKDKAPAPKKKLLLLDDDPEPKPGDKPKADNSRCHVCHVNYEKEELAVVHAQANIGCAKCHGASDAHIADESWASGGNGTAPTIIYPRDKINKACQTCHEINRNDPERKCLFPTEDDKKVCTDCHGKHRLHARKCKWK